jgi:NADH-ubiquinone oxidoreductase chain 1
MNTVGYYGILQPFADALKLILKETVIPSQSNKIIFYLAPVSTLVFSLLGWAVIPFGQGLVLSDLSLGILYTLALSSLGVIGLLFSVWLANSKFSIKKDKLAFKQNKDYKIK